MFQGRFPSSKIPGRNKIIGMFDAEWILMLFDNLTEYLLSWSYKKITILNLPHSESYWEYNIKCTTGCEAEILWSDFKIP